MDILRKFTQDMLKYQEVLNHFLIPAELEGKQGNMREMGRDAYGNWQTTRREQSGHFNYMKSIIKDIKSGHQSYFEFQRTLEENVSKTDQELKNELWRERIDSGNLKSFFVDDAFYYGKVVAEHLLWLQMESPEVNLSDSTNIH